MNPTQTADLAVVGAGPTGLYAAYCAGLRGLRPVLIDSMQTPGGQVAALFPDKHIYDAAGFPEVTGSELVQRLVAQAQSASPTYMLNRVATHLTGPEGGPFTLILDTAESVQARAVLITAGVGGFRPRPFPAGTGWEGRGLEHTVTDHGQYLDQDVVVVGGGDSAVDWALHLEPTARSVCLVHRRPRLRAHKASQNALAASTVEVHLSAQVTEIRGDSCVQEVVVTPAQGEPWRRPVQRIVAALGFLADLGPILGWGLDTQERRLLVDATMQTSFPGIYAAGDVAQLPGKIRLLTVGFAEAAIAVNHIASRLEPGASVFPGHSTDRPRVDVQAPVP